MSNGYEQAQERVQTFDGILQDYLEEHPRTDPQWQQLEPYIVMFHATQRYANAALKDAIWGFAQAYVDVASTGYLGKKATSSHVEIPAEFSDLFKGMLDDILTTNPPNAADEIGAIYDIMMAGMYDAITVGPIPRWTVTGFGGDAASVNAHLEFNETLFRQEAEVIYEIKQAYRRLGPIGFAIKGAELSTGKEGPPPERAYELVFYTGEGADERPPVWAQLHMASLGSQVVVEIGRQTGYEFRKAVTDAAGVPALQSMGAGLTDVMGALGGVTGALGMLAGVAALGFGGFYLYQTLQKGR